MKSEMIETRTVKIRLDDDGIVRIETKPNVTKQSLSDATENMEALDRIRLKKKRPVFIDIRKAMSTDAEGRRYYSRAELADDFSAGAFIVGSPLSRVIGSLFLGISKLPFPVKLFTSPDKALAWLEGFIEQNSSLKYARRRDKNEK